MVAPPGQGCLRERQGLCPQELPEPCRVRLTDQSFLWDSPPFPVLSAHQCQ